MPRTRKGSRTGADASFNLDNKENERPSPKSEHRKSAGPPTQSKALSEDEARQAVAPKPAKKLTKKQIKEAEEEAERERIQHIQATRPRLTTPDLEFDYDRSQLRDPRPTPGYVRRPRHEDLDYKGEVGKQQFRDRFYIPEPEKPKGRLNAYQKDELYGQKALLDPMMIFHDLHVCYEKGPNGSRTYDSAGFQLSYSKVRSWMQPRAYNKKSIMNSMGRSLARGESEIEQIYRIFFTDGKVPEDEFSMMDYIKDKISKDIGVPFHRSGRNMRSNGKRWALGLSLRVSGGVKLTKKKRKG
ncbi:hypothetical protein LTR64_000530 [Lithohypha guttulata]|uniref:uncharacterized protein n=1 Tax=Lithohypha guttulata TaxID=1690604 RepID=UPI002DE0CB90|nr:hypothetical protein LTR51_005703 [Lithohypha guttulata]